MERVSFMSWSRMVEARILPQLDVGLMPLRAGSWESGKGGYKAVQYMACGVPTVASDVPAARLVLQHGKTGLLVPADEEWVPAMSSLIQDPEMRQLMGRQARATRLSRDSPSISQQDSGAARYSRTHGPKPQGPYTSR